jgi:hypothetical protein
MTEKTESFIGADDLARMRQAMKDHPETEHTSAGGWCKYCGCGNDLFGYKHLQSCNRPRSTHGERDEQK